MFANLKEDIKRYKKSDKSWFDYLFTQGIWALVVYRYCRWARNIKIPIINFVLRAVGFLMFKLIEIISGISIPSSVEIGSGFYIGHFGGIIINDEAKIGKNCSIGTGVIIGTRGLGDKGVPIIGDNVYIGVGAKILGGIKIGDNSKIGANAVVLCDVPVGHTAVGIPARIIKQKVI